MVEQAGPRPFPVVAGFLPADLPAGSAADILTFNDVFEHLPDPKAVFDASREAIRPDGLLVLSLPTSDGTIHRVSRWLARPGIGAPFARLWQKDLPSPHRHYFRTANLVPVFDRAGFEVLEIATLPSLTREG